MALKPSAVCVGFLLFAANATAQIQVNPQGVNVSGQGASTVLLTFGRLQGYVAIEAMWCGELVAAAPDIGRKCDPSTIFGLLPDRYFRSQPSGSDAYTDIMSVPPSVARRAYEAAAAGESGAFFYVRRFVNPAGGADQYVAVTCRLTAGGARVPLSLVDVRLEFAVDTPVLQVKAGGAVAPFAAHLQYTGTGRLKGRWEVVMPGQDLPSDSDLLTEATLPAERRGTQRRFTEIERFNVFLPPTGRLMLDGPDPARLPTNGDGQYLVLLRIEASDDKEADSNLSAVGAGPGVVHAGAVAGFPMPVLRYFVGSGGSEHSPGSPVRITASSPIREGTAPIDLRWSAVARALYYRIEVTAAGQRAHVAFVRPPSDSYSLPPFVQGKVAGADALWRVLAIDDAGRIAGQSDWLVLGVSKPEKQ